MSDASDRANVVQLLRNALERLSGFEQRVARIELDHIRDEHGDLLNEIDDTIQRLQNAKALIVDQRTKGES